MKRASSWAVHIGRALAEVAIACVLVSHTEGPFQTTVVCLLGLTLQRVRFSMLEARAMGKLMGFSIIMAAGFAKEQADTVEELERNLDKQMRSMVTPESTVMTVEGWILNVVFVVGILKACLTLIG